MTEVRIIASDGTELGRADRDDGAVVLTSEIEMTVWARASRRLYEDLARMDALRSRQITVGLDGLMRLDNGEPVTDEIMEEWGWKKTRDGWVHSG